MQEVKDILLSRKRDDVAIKEQVDQVCKGFKNDLVTDSYITYNVVIEMGYPVIGL